MSGQHTFEHVRLGQVGELMFSSLSTAFSEPLFSECQTFSTIIYGFGVQHSFQQIVKSRPCPTNVSSILVPRDTTTDSRPCEHSSLFAAFARECVHCSSSLRDTSSSRGRFAEERVRTSDSLFLRTSKCSLTALRDRTKIIRCSSHHRISLSSPMKLPLDRASFLEVVTPPFQPVVPAKKTNGNCTCCCGSCSMPTRPQAPPPQTSDMFYEVP